MNGPLITTSPLSLNGNSKIPPLMISEQPYVTQNGLLNGLIWNRGQLVHQDNIPENQS